MVESCEPRLYNNNSNNGNAVGKGEDGSKRLHYNKVATFGGLTGKIWRGKGGMKMSST